MCCIAGSPIDRDRLGRRFRARMSAHRAARAGDGDARRRGAGARRGSGPRRGAGGARLAEARSQLLARVLSEPAGPWPDRLQHAGPGPMGLLVLAGRARARAAHGGQRVGGAARAGRPDPSVARVRAVDAAAVRGPLDAARADAVRRARAQLRGGRRALPGGRHRAARPRDRPGAPARAHAGDLAAQRRRAARADAVLASRRALGPRRHRRRRHAARPSAPRRRAPRRRAASDRVDRARPLRESGAIERRPDGSWVLHGEPAGLPTEATARVVRFRRRPAPVR